MIALIAHDSASAQILAPASPCDSVAGTVVTCSGDVHQGVLAISPTFQTLNVVTSTDITPASGVAGIRQVDRSTSNNITVNVDTSGAPNGIVTSGSAPGILVQIESSLGKSSTLGDFVIVNKGNIASNGTRGVGIDANVTAYNRSTTNNVTAASGILAVTSQGNIQTKLHGTGVKAFNDAFAQSDVAGATAASGDLTVTSTGNISTGKALGNDGGIGIFANNSSSAFANGSGDATTKTGAVTITSTGNISVKNSGIGIFAGISAGAGAQNGAASATSGNITILSTGTITTGASGRGIFASNNNTSANSTIGSASANAGDILITNAGNISTGFGGLGIQVLNAANGTLGNITITSSGSISGGANGYGILTTNLSGFTKSGNVAVNILGGTVSAGSNGIAIRMDGGQTHSVTNYGTIVTADSINGYAVAVNSANSAAVSNFGTIVGNVDLGHKLIN